MMYKVGWIRQETWDVPETRWPVRVCVLASAAPILQYYNIQCCQNIFIYFFKLLFYKYRWFFFFLRNRPVRLVQYYTHREYINELSFRGNPGNCRSDFHKIRVNPFSGIRRVP